MTPLFAVLTLLILLASSHGLGFAVMKWGVRDGISHFSLLTVIGVACLMFLGGILNLVGLAYPAAMYALVLLGLVLFILSFFARFKILSQHGSFLHSDDSARITSLLDRLLPLSLVALAVLFFAATLLPSDAFNFHDDFHTYVPRPLRMLQVGTLGGNPYELLGLDSLGAQAFLQGFILLALPVGYLPGFDAVFGLALAGLLLVTTARKFNLSWVYAVPAILTFLAINPQSVNVSALYSGVFVILGALLTSYLLTKKLNEPGIKKSLGMAALVGVFIASLVALKTTLVLFAAIYCALFCLGLFAIAQNKRRALLLSATTVLAATITILPWLLLHLPNYLAALGAPLHSASTTNASGFSLPKGNVSKLFSTHDLFYGGSMLGYGSIILVLVVLCIFSIFFILRSNHARQRGCALVSASACAAAVASYFLGGLLFDPETAVRYVCPVLIAVLPFALLASSFNATEFARQRPESLAWVGKSSILAGAALVVALFGNNLASRIELAYSKRTTLSFPVSDAYIQYNLYVLSEKAQQATLKIQNQTEAGAKILAWISMPLHLDFARNEIQVVMEPGLINPWLDMPLSGNPAEVVQYLKKHEIRYILWKYRGAGMKDRRKYEEYLFSPFPLYRKIAERNLYMRDILTAIMAGGNFIYHQNGIVLFDLDQIN